MADLTYVWTRAGFVLRGLRHRRLQPGHRGLAGVCQPAHRPRPRRPRDGHLARGARRCRTRPPLRPRRPVPVHPLHRAPRRGRRRSSSVGSRGDSYDNALAETRQRPLQGRAHPPQGPGARVEQVELGDRCLGRTGGTPGASTPPAATCHRPSTRRPTISASRRPAGRLNQSAESPRNPVRFKGHRQNHWASRGRLHLRSTSAAWTDITAAAARRSAPKMTSGASSSARHAAASGRMALV